ncbi:hypothetical protein TRICI_005711 [Trichomonascus ciferrii]|uniref:Uncharacterized protein n=1 Tax=Trichomonascus ciferrii TaxID=44093 RepID=A0A642UQC8_9ASCO|nr:hypothetical protein TRICI_005711 [Trichomonascus ciferrii]
MMTVASAAPSQTNSPVASPRLKPTLHLQAQELESLDLNKIDELNEHQTQSRPITPPPDVDLENLDQVRASKNQKIIQNARLHFRCRVSELYAGLLRCQQDGNHEKSSATHDWSLGNIQSICMDLLYRIPAGEHPENSASYFFNNVDSHEVQTILDLLCRAIKNHDLVNSMHEQLQMGTL